jgi:hypothetical protein
MPEQKPIAFMSYVRNDDEHEEGRLSLLRDRLSGEVRMQTGEEFPIFQDRTDIKWGDNWKARLEDTLDIVTFFIPIITPSYFKSAACRNELETFIQHEKMRKRHDLILPIIYVECPLLKNKNKMKADPLAKIISSRQYEDWSHLRFAELSSPQVKKRLVQLAVQIRDAMERTAGATAAQDEYPELTGVRLTLDKQNYKPGEQIRVQFWASSSFSEDAWVGIVPSHISHGSEELNDYNDISFRYLNNWLSGDLRFRAPMRPGEYDMRMHDTDNNGKEVAFTQFVVISKKVIK